jgi:hypothetical protein
MKAALLLASLAAAVAASNGESSDAPAPVVPQLVTDFKLPAKVGNVYLSKSETIHLQIETGAEPQGQTSPDEATKPPEIKLQAWLLLEDGRSLTQTSKTPIGVSNAGFTSYSVIFEFSKQPADEPVALVLGIDGELFTKSLTKTEPPQKEGAATWNDPPAGLEFLTTVPELRGVSLQMKEDDFNRLAARRKIKITKDDSRAGQSTYSVETPSGENVIVMFTGGTCSGIQRLQPTRPQPH